MRARILLLFAVLTLLPFFSQAAPSSAHGIRVIVLDAGHGGNDPGAHYAGVYEKDLTLKVVLRLGKRIEQGMPGVKVVYTRKTDKALAPTKIEDLQKRADIANAAEGDLFLSVHVNAAKSTSAKGVETLIMGESTKEQRYNEEALYESNRDELLDMSDEREAAIIRAHIENLQFTYGEFSQMMANSIQQRYTAAGRHSRGVKPQLLRVLYATNMPGVLTEIGFLSNKEEAAYLKSEKGINQIVDALYRAVNDYSESVKRMRAAEEEQPAAKQPRTPQPAEKPATAPATKTATTTPEKPAAKPAEKPAAKSAEKPAAQQKDRRLFDARLYAEASAVIEQPVKQSMSTTEVPAAKVEIKSEEQTFYTIQVMAARKPLSPNDPAFKEYRKRVVAYKGEGSYPYKYGVGRYKSHEEATKAVVVIRRSFTNCFIIAVKEHQLLP